METSEAWITRRTKSPEIRRFYEEERLILWTTEEIAGAMVDQGLSRAKVAEKIGTTRANVTQLLSGSRNMTLRSLAKLAFACGMRAEIHLEELNDSVFNQIHDQTVPVLGTAISFSTEYPWPELPLDTTVLTGLQSEDGDSEGPQLLVDLAA